MKGANISFVSNHRRTFVFLSVVLFSWFFVIFLSPALSSEEVDTGWNGVPIDTDLNLNDVATLNMTSALVVGESGKIFYTANSGNNWSEEESGTILDLNSIEFSGVAVTVGDSGAVLIKDGDVWVDNSIPDASNLYDVSIVSYQSLEDSTIFVSGMSGEIWKWTNNSWMDLSNYTLVETDLYGIDFFDEEEGFAVGADGTIIATFDGGLNWELRSVPDEIKHYSFYDLALIPYKSEYPVRLFVVGENGTFIRSDHKSSLTVGYDWIVWNTNINTTSTLRSVSYSSNAKLWVVGDDNFVSLTENGGQAFINQSQPQTLNVDFSGVSFVDGKHGFAVGDEGSALFTDREGIDPALLDTAKSFDTFWEYAKYAYPFLKEGMNNTLKIIVLAIFMGFAIGVTLAVFKTSQFFLFIPTPITNSNGVRKYLKFNPLKFFATIYTDIFRNTPLLVQFFFIYFGLVQVGIDLTFENILGEDRALERAYGSAVVALGLNSGAYQTEIIRSGIQAIPAGQMEAGRSIGLTYLQSMRFVILPQAIRIVIPPLGNETVNLVLNSALASAIGFGEITRKGRLLISLTFETFWTWGLVLMFYFVITYTLANILKYIEKRLKIPGLGIGGED
ncbi:MAG: ABC transporter permease subunit [Candidatus Thermoplasmatota archaeon]|nr:ABC transporter permease subunit [Candidatus Thermoplasmatota archaeon]